MTNEKTPRKTPILSQLLRLFFRLLYHPFAWTYDLVASTVSLGRWNQWVLEAVNLLPGPRILEVGFGPGHLQVHLRKSGKSVFGVDESWQMARQARRRLVNAGQPARLARGLAQAMPFSSTSFHNVVATFPSPYIVDPATLAEIQRVLMPGGRLVVLMGAWITGSSPAERMMRALFDATAQSPAEDVDIAEYIEPYQKAGFQASIRFVEKPGSRLMFILASKTAGQYAPERTRV